MADRDIQEYLDEFFAPGTLQALATLLVAVGVAFVADVCIKNAVVFEPYLNFLGPPFLRGLGVGWILYLVCSWSYLKPEWRMAIVVFSVLCFGTASFSSFGVARLDVVFKNSGEFLRPRLFEEVHSKEELVVVSEDDPGIWIPVPRERCHLLLKLTTSRGGELAYNLFHVEEPQDTLRPMFDFQLHHVNKGKQPPDVPTVEFGEEFPDLPGVHSAEWVVVQRLSTLTSLVSTPLIRDRLAPDMRPAIWMHGLKNNDVLFGVNAQTEKMFVVQNDYVQQHLKQLSFELELHAYRYKESLESWAMVLFAIFFCVVAFCNRGKILMRS